MHQEIRKEKVGFSLIGSAKEIRKHLICTQFSLDNYINTKRFSIFTSTSSVTKLYILVECGDFHFCCNSPTFARQALCVTVTKLQVKRDLWHWIQAICQLLRSRQPMITFVRIWSHLMVFTKATETAGQLNCYHAITPRIIPNHIPINFVNFKDDPYYSKQLQAINIQI